MQTNWISLEGASPEEKMSRIVEFSAKVIQDYKAACDEMYSVQARYKQCEKEVDLVIALLNSEGGSQ